MNCTVIVRVLAQVFVNFVDQKTHPLSYVIPANAGIYSVFASERSEYTNVFGFLVKPGMTENSGTKCHFMLALKEVRSLITLLRKKATSLSVKVFSGC